MSSSTPRRSGFRLPWAGETPGGETPEGQTQPAEPELAAEESTNAKEATPETASAKQATAKEATPVPTPEPTAEPAPPPAAPEPQPTSEFLHEMIAAMRGVAEQARTKDVAELRTKVEEHVTRLKAEAEERVAELRRRAEADVTAIGEWAKSEAERIRAEAESRVAARRQQLDQQLAADAKRAEREAEEIGGRVSEYERELDAFFAQLGEISDPAAFAAAAKRMPHAPKVAIDAPSAPAEASETNAGRMAALGLGEASAEEQPDAPAKGTPAANGTATAAGSATASTGQPAETEKQPTDAELAARLAELDEKLAGKPAAAQATAAPPAVATGDAEVATTVVVKGLGSFGAITAFKQGLEGVDGIRSVTLSLGPSGEFVYRATHAGSFDLEAAIHSVERGATSIDRQPDGALRVTISRPPR
jgi:F0F1-type ATP synthase membrane subunit b/b'